MHTVNNVEINRKRIYIEYVLHRVGNFLTFFLKIYSLVLTINVRSRPVSTVPRVNDHRGTCTFLFVCYYYYFYYRCAYNARRRITENTDTNIKCRKIGQLSSS